MRFSGGSDGKESTCNKGDLGSVPGLGRSPGGWNSYPLQYSGLENSMDSLVHGVAKSQTWLSDFHLTSLDFTISVLWFHISTLYKPEIFYEAFKTQGCIFTRIGKVLAVALVLILICSSAFLLPLYCGFWGFLSFAVNSAVKKILVTNQQKTHGKRDQICGYQRHGRVGRVKGRNWMNAVKSHKLSVQDKYVLGM